MEIRDNAGNSFIAEAIPPFGNIEVSLRLVSHKTRKLGVINQRTRTLYVRRNATTHIYRNTNSYAFNSELITNSKLPYDNIILTVGRTKYKLPRDLIFGEGSYQMHRQAGFELQLFLPISIIKKYKIE